MFSLSKSPMLGRHPTEASAKSKNARKKARQKANANAVPNNDADAGLSPEKHDVESREQMKHRLSNPQTYKNAHRLNIDINTMNASTDNKIDPLGQEEIELILSDVSEIKELLFCRLLLSRASLLPAALKSNSIEEFLSDHDISNAELRGLCLKMGNPSLQEIRDACADLKRHEDEVESDDEGTKEGPKQVKKSSLINPRIISKLPANIQTKREKALKKRRDAALQDSTGGFIDFGQIDDQRQFQTKRISIKVCGRQIYNYPSEKAMSRGGWYQFSIIAKDSAADDAINLCRNWEEFSDLVTLISLDYFPSTGWIDFMRDYNYRHLTQLTCIPYFSFYDADKMSRRDQTARNAGPRQHSVLESRNWICAVMNRDDPITRRFIQYVAMRSSRMVMLVRDVVTGDVLVHPPDEELWVARTKMGMGRISRGEWEVLDFVGPKFMERLDGHRSWSLGFKDYYDIIIWDFLSGQSFDTLVDEISTCLFKAIRCYSGLDSKKPFERVYRSVAMDKLAGRCRDAKPGEETLWDAYSNGEMKFVGLAISDMKVKSVEEFPDRWKYNEADRLEDEVLFPWGQLKTGATDTKAVSGGPLLALENNRLHNFGSKPPDLERFVLGIEADEDVSEEEMQQRRAKIGAMVAKNGKATQSGDHESDFEPGDGDSTEGDYEEEDNEELDIYEFFDDDEQPLSPKDAALENEAIQAAAKWITTGSFGSSMKRLALHDAPTKKAAKKLMAEVRQRQRSQVKDEFDLWLDIERAVAFKGCWHAADLEPGAQVRWTEYQNLLKSYEAWIKHSAPAKARYGGMKRVFELLTLMEVDNRSHNRVISDMFSAGQMTDLFFDSGQGFLHTEEGHPFKQCLLLNKALRAKKVPDRRTPNSVRSCPANQWKQWDDMNRSDPYTFKADRYPPFWNAITRPIIAYLYREGIICSAYDNMATGSAMVIEEPNREDKPDLFCDFRSQTDDAEKTPGMTDPLTLPSFPEQARKYDSKHPGARFTILKLWSAPHFWPLMVGIENRSYLSFIDAVGRIWNWKFVPKDMPNSEWSIHRSARMRFEQFAKFFVAEQREKECEVSVRKDMFIIKAKDEETCRWLTTAATFAIQTRPWRFEVDPWKSWFNVDVEFIESLQREWWD